MTATTSERREVARSGLIRTTSFVMAGRDDADLDDGDGAGGPASGDGRTLQGYAAVFNSPTRIDSWEGTFDEVVAPGAFKKTLRERTPVLQFDHGRHPLIGSIPIGVITDAREDSHGVSVTASLTDNWLVQPVRDAIAVGAVNGMSFRFEVIREEWRTAAGNLVTDDDVIYQMLWLGEDNPDGVLQRTLKELAIPELGPVVFPAYQDTEVSMRGREVLRALADPAVRRDVARAAILTPPAPAPEDKQQPVTPPDGHLTDRNDAPPAGHPSESPTPDARTAALLAGMRDRLTQVKEGRGLR